MSDNKWVTELKTVLQVAKARLDVREKKKSEQVAKERYTVADYVRNNKVPRSRIAVEHLVREDYKIEAMDRVEAYVDTLLMRMQLIKDRPKNGIVDPAVEQPLANILWAAPFLGQDIPELVQVTNMFKRHFGLEYVTMCEQNKLGMVDVDLLRCLSCDLIPKLLIEKYLVEICRSQNVPFEPDQTIMAQDEFWNIGGRYAQNPPSQPSSYVGGQPYGGGPPNAGGQPYGGGPPNAGGQPYGSGPPNGGGQPYGGGPPNGGGQPYGGGPPNGSGSSYGGGPPNGGGSSYGSGPSNGSARSDFPNAPAPPPSAPTIQPQYPNINFAPSLPPPQPSSTAPRFGFGANNTPQPPVHDPFPQVPISNDRPLPPGAHGGSNDPGFDDLARRFEDLKNRK